MIIIVTGVLIIVALTLAVYVKHTQVTDQTIVDLKNLAVELDEKYTGLDIRPSSISTTVNKKTIMLCVYDPVSGRPYSQNTLMGVLIHELAHYESESYGEHADDHNDEWHEKYAAIRDKAVEKGLYNPKFPPPKTYCKTE